MSVPERICPVCGETTYSIDPLPCPRCGEMLWESVAVVPAKVSRAITDLARRATVAEAKVDRMANARTRKRQQTSEEKKADAIRRYQAGELVKNIAEDLRRSERWVYETIPENMKRRR